MNKQLLLFCCCSLLLAVPAIAQDDFWVQTSGPFDENVLGLAVDSCGGLIATTINGTFRSTDLGASWLANAQLAGEILSGIIVLPGGEILISGRSKLFRSTDCGATWEKDSGAHIPRVEYVEFARAPDGTLYGCNGDSFGTPGVSRGVYRSTDMGRTWTITCVEILAALTVAVNQQGHFFCGAAPLVHGVYRSTNRGDSCQQVLKPEKVFYNVSAVGVNSKGYVFATTDANQCWMSVDNGENWRHVTWEDGLPRFSSFRSVFFDKQDRIYVGTGGHGVYRSSDDGATWAELPGNFSVSETINSFALDSLGYLYAGTLRGSGVYRSRFPIMTVSVDANDSEIEPTLQVRPQPLRQNGTLEFSLPRAMTVTLALYDVLGRPVRVVHRGGLMPGGRHTLALERAGLPAGLYFMRMATPDGVVSRQLVLSR